VIWFEDYFFGYSNKYALGVFEHTCTYYIKMELFDIPPELIDSIFRYLSDRYGLLRCVCRRLAYLPRKTQGRVACETLSLVEYAGDEATFVRASGNIEILKHLKGFRKWDYHTTDSIGYSAAKEGHLDTLLWLQSLDITHVFPSDIGVSAARGYNIRILEWLKNKDCIDIGVLYEAGSYGNIRVADWVIKTFVSIDGTNCRGMADGAVRNGQIEFLKWLYSRVGRRINFWDRITVTDAVASGNLEVVKWIHGMGCPWGQAAEKATVNGYLDILKWMRSLPVGERCPWSSKCTVGAAIGGYLDMLKWMRGLPAGERCPWTSRAIAAAATHGSLDTVKWMRSLYPVEERCPWDEETAKNAAIYGHLEILKWIRDLPPDERCPWGVSTISSWRGGGVHAQGGWFSTYFSILPMCEIDTIIRWMRGHPGSDRCPWDEHTSKEAVAVCSLETFQWMRTQPEEDRCPWNMEDILHEAVYSKRPDIIEWICSLPLHERAGWSIDTIRSTTGRRESYLNSLPIEE
jgi:hypothetical protein